MTTPDAAMCAKFLRSQKLYLDTGKTEWPYVNSARAIGDISVAAADLLEVSGAVRQAERLTKIKTALLGIVGRYEDNGGVVEQEFIDRARQALFR